MKRNGIEKKVVVLLLLGIMLVTGCQSKQEDANARQELSQGQQGGSDSNKEPVELYLFSASGSNQEWFDNTYGKYLAEKFPHIKLHVAFPSEMSISDYIATHAPLDIIFGAYTSFHGSVLNLNLQSDISDLIKEHQYDLTRLDPTIVQMQQQIANGGMYGLPAFIGAAGLYYNIDIFDKFAVDYPFDGMIWDEVYDMAVKLTRKDGDIQYYGLAHDHSGYFQTNPFSLDLVDPVTLQANFQSDAWKKVIQNFTRLAAIPDYSFAETTVTKFNNTGNIAMAASYAACCGNTPGEAVVNFDLVSIPSFPEIKDVGPQVFPNFWYMSSISKNRDAAFEIMQYITSNEFQKSLNDRGLATVLNDKQLHETYASSMPKFAGKNVAALFPKNRAKVSTITEFQLDAANKLMSAFNEIVNNGVDINTALRQAAEETNKIIQAKLDAAK